MARLVHRGSEASRTWTEDGWTRSHVQIRHAPPGHPAGQAWRREQPGVRGVRDGWTERGDCHVQRRTVGERRWRHQVPPTRAEGMRRTRHRRKRARHRRAHQLRVPRVLVQRDAKAGTERALALGVQQHHQLRRRGRAPGRCGCRRPGWRRRRSRRGGAAGVRHRAQPRDGGGNCQGGAGEEPGTAGTLLPVRVWKDQKGLAALQASCVQGP
mmetsp:Transcript_598/g.1453  ORF Transcript_598/g.1453 Transcript_598/m.1453 type:complete len:212 (-) Transcript_598:1028-1663(-)